MTLAMKQRTICLLLVLIVYCVNKSDGSTDGRWAKTFSSSSASSHASAYSSSSSFSSGPIDLKQIHLPVATAFATAKADAHSGATAGALASATAGATSVSDAGSESPNIGSGSFNTPGLAFSGLNSGSLAHSGVVAGGAAYINNKHQTEHQSSGQSASDGSLLTNTIAGAYAPTSSKENEVKNNAGIKNGYYSHDFVLPSRDTESDYDSSDETETQKTSSIGFTGSTSTTLGSHDFTKSSVLTGVTPIHNEIATPEFGKDLSGSITTNTHLKSPIGATTKFPFPGSSGSINDYKPAPPGGGGPDKAWLVTPIGTGAYSSGQASSDASSHASSSGINFKLISSFPGAPGSIHDSKPASNVPVNPSLSTGVGCSGGSCSQTVASKPSYDSVSGCSSGTSCGTHTSPLTGQGISAVLSTLPGSPGSIYDSKPVVGCTSPGCIGQSTSGSYKPSSPISNTGTNYPSVSGSAGIHDSNPVITCNHPACSGKVPSGSYKPSFPDNNVGSGYPLLPGGAGSIHESKPVSGCTSSGCSNEYPSGSHKPSTTIPHYPSFPGSSGSIYDNKPVLGGVSSAMAGSNAQSVAGTSQGTHQPDFTAPTHPGSSYPSLPGSSGSIHSSKPVITCNYPGCAGQVPTETYKPSTQVTNGGSGYPTLPGGAFGIHESKPVSGCTSSGCSNQYPNGLHESSTTIPGYPFPGSSGSIHDSKPVSGEVSSAMAGSNAQGVAGASQGTTHEPAFIAPTHPGSNYPSLPGSSGSIHNSKPVVTCNYSGCAGQVSTEIYKPDTPVSNGDFGYPTLPGGAGGIYESKPVAGCTSSGCSGQYPSGSYKPSSTISGYPSFPGSSGSIYDSKPVAGTSQGAHQPTFATPTHQGTASPDASYPVSHIPSPGSTNQGKPVYSNGDMTGTAVTSAQTQVGSNINPDLPNIIINLPGQPGSIFNSKPSSTASAQANAYANANAGASANIPCTGSSCAYRTSSDKKTYGTSKCSGSACKSHFPSTPGSFIPVKVISGGYYHNKPTIGLGGCSGNSCGNKQPSVVCTGPSCGGYNAEKPSISTELVAPSVSTLPSHSVSNLPSGCVGASCSGLRPSSSQSSCSGFSCSGEEGALAQTGSAESSSISKASTGTEAGLFTSKPTVSSTGSLNTEKDVTSQTSLTCSAGSPGCSKSGEEKVNNGVISGPGTGSIPIDESSSGSYLGLKIPGDSGDNVKPVVEIPEETAKPSGCTGTTCSSTGNAGSVKESGAYSSSTGTTGVSSGTNLNSYHSGSTGLAQPVGGCSGQLCGSNSAGSQTNQANGFSTGSVYVQGADGVIFPGPDNSKTYGTEKPGIACTTGNCGSQSYGSSGSYSGGCTTGNCGSHSANSAGATASASSGTGCSGGGCGNLGYNRADGTATLFGGTKSTSGAYSSASSVAGSGIDLGPLAHFFGSKGGAVAKAGSYSSSGSLANSGSFASSFSSATAGSY